jgi:hypothetical protein
MGHCGASSRPSISSDDVKDQRSLVWAKAVKMAELPSSPNGTRRTLLENHVDADGKAVQGITTVSAVRTYWKYSALMCMNSDLHGFTLSGTRIPPGLLSGKVL